MSAGRFLVIVSLLLVFLVAPLGAIAQQPVGSPDRPRGGLFSEEGPSGRPLSLGWFVLGLYVLVGLVFAGASAQLAVHKALPPIPWFFAGLFFNAVAYLVLLTRPPGDASEFPAGIPRGLRKVPCTYYSEECPGCGYGNHPGAHCCLGCGSEFHPPFDSEAAHWRKKQQLH